MTRRKQSLKTKYRLSPGQLVASILMAAMMACFLGVFIAGQSRLPSDRQHIIPDAVQLADGWTGVYADRTEESFTLPGIIKGSDRQLHSLTRQLPDDVRNEWLMIWNKGHYIEVYVGGELREETEIIDHHNNDRSVPYHYTFIPLSEKDAGTTLEVVFPNLNNENRELGEVYYGSQLALLVSAVNGQQSGLICAFLLISLGIIALILSIGIYHRTGESLEMVFLGTGVASAAMWFLLNEPIVQFLTSNIGDARDCAFFIAALLPVPFLLFLDTVQNGRYRKMFLVLEVLCFVDMGSLMIGHIMFGISLNRLFLQTEIVSVVGILCTIGTIVKDAVDKRLEEYALQGIGLAGFLASVLIYVVFYALFPYRGNSGVLFMAGLLFLFFLAIFSVVMDLREVYIARGQAERAVRSLSRGAMKSLAHTVDAKDKYTRGHSERVADYSRHIAQAMGKTGGELEAIYNIALLHDVGKIGVPDSIINKTGKLTHEEYEIIKSHTVVGAEILSEIKDMRDLSVGARWHHERYDGTGYPDGLKGQAIPEIARIICVADSYDAMTSNRSYRKALPQEVVRLEIEKGSGSQFDPVIAQVMLDMIDADTHYEMREL